MNRVISDKIKTSIIEQVVFGDDVRDVAEKYQVSKVSIYRWMKDYEYRQKYNTDNLLTLAQMKRNMDRATQKLHILSSAPCGAKKAKKPILVLFRKKKIKHFQKGKRGFKHINTIFILNHKPYYYMVGCKNKDKNLNIGWTVIGINIIKS